MAIKNFLIPYVACIIFIEQYWSKKYTCGCKDKPAVDKGDLKTGSYLQALITLHQVRLDKGGDGFQINFEENE